MFENCDVMVWLFYRDELVKSREELMGEKEKLTDGNNQLQMKRDALEENVADMEMENQRKAKEITRWYVSLITIPLFITDQ